MDIIQVKCDLQSADVEMDSERTFMMTERTNGCPGIIDWLAVQSSRTVRLFAVT